MSRQNDDATMVSSSIALLQERFRELQRSRERRREKELLKLFSESERIASSKNCESGKITCQPEMNIFPNTPPHRPESLLSLGLNSKSKRADFQGMKTPASLWPKTGGSSSRNFESCDVDTSLHL